MRNGLQEKKRSFFVVVGDHSKDAIVYRQFDILRLFDLQRLGLTQYSSSHLFWHERETQQVGTLGIQE
jgi:hypothetical protein